MPNNNEQYREEDRERRKVVYTLAKATLKNHNASIQQIRDCLNSLPESGHKALALKVRLQRKLEGLPHEWEVE